MKQQQHDIKCKESSEKSESQMGFELTLEFSWLHLDMLYPFSKL